MKRLFNRRGYVGDGPIILIMCFFIFTIVSLMVSNVISDRDYENFISDARNQCISILKENDDKGFVDKKEIENLTRKLNDSKKDNYEIVIKSDTEPVKYDEDMYISVYVRRIGSRGAVINSDTIYETTTSKYKGE